MACSDVQTIQAGNGTKTQFSFDFPYIFKSEIHVYFWNAVTKEYDEKLTTDATYPWQITDANPTIVEFTGTAPPSPATPVDPGEPTVDNVKIRRITKVDDIRALFNPGSAIRSDDLNKNFEQLRYAIQEANCQGIPDDVDAYLKEYYWDRFDNTLYAADTWRSNDATIATTAALDQRFQDEVSETFTKAELAAASNQMPDNDTAVPTTGALNDYINEVITNDIGTDGTGITITDDGDGTITLGLADNTIDFDKIKDVDQIKLADQVADPDVVGTDNNIFTAQAATRRFNNYYQNDAPPVTDGIGVGQIWVDPNDDLTLSVWSGSGWVGVTSGGTFTNQPKVVYVDSVSGDDSNDGHRISRPKKTIKAALADINADANGDGSIVSVAPGIYAETLPLDIQKNDVGVIGQSLRTCIIHPKIPTSDQPTYGVNTPHSQELQTMFRVNSGSYFTNLTLTGLKASGTRGGSGSLYTDSTYGLPPNQGWNFAFYPNAVIKKSPYIQNCTNFSDSQINNVNFTPHTPGEGAAGDLDSAPTGGGILVDGSVPAANSPLRSIVCDSYTHTALDGPGLFVTNNGYTQCTSSYAFFNHAHITCINGGQANLAASTSDFGRFALIADGKSTNAIFTSNVDGAAADNSKTFNINAPTAGSGWHGSATRPQDNMLVTVNSVTYPVLSAVARTDSEGGAGWTVTISRPDPSDTASNLGLNGAVSDNASVEFFLRSMIASSGHTMEYVGSGTDYTALPENGGVPIDANQVVERNNGKVWSAITDHKGKFSLGDFFTVDQQSKAIVVNPGSFQVDLSTLSVDATGNAVFGANLDMGSNQITSSSGNLKLNASGDIDAQTNKIINVTDPTAAQDAATKNYVDNNFIDSVVQDTSPQLGGNLDVNGNQIISTSNSDITINPNGTGNVVLGSPVKVENGQDGEATILLEASSTVGNDAEIKFGENGNTANRGMIAYPSGAGNRFMSFDTDGSERMRITNTGLVGIGTSSPGSFNANGDNLVIQNSDGTGSAGMTIRAGTGAQSTIYFADGTSTSAAIRGYVQYAHNGDFLRLGTDANERLRIDASGNVGIGTTTPGNYLASAHQFVISDAASTGITIATPTSSSGTIAFADGTGAGDNARGLIRYGHSDNSLRFSTNAGERVRIDSSGNMGIGATDPQTITHILGADPVLRIQDSSTAITGAFAAIQLAESVGGGGLGNYWQIAMEGESVTSTDHLTFKDGTGERMRIDSSGRLLVGATTSIDVASSAPAKLQVTHAANSLSAALYSTVDSVGPAGVLALGHGRGSVTGLLSDDDVMGQIRFAGADGTDLETVGAQISAEVDGTPGSNDMPGRLVFSTTADGASSPTERVRIKSSGNVGIGDTGPNFKLDVNGDVGIREGNNLVWHDGSGTTAFRLRAESNNKLFFERASGNEAQMIIDDGKVGIGTSSPAQLLDLASTTPNIRLTDTVDGHSEIDGNAASLKFNADKGNSKSGTNISFAVDNTERMRIDNNGRLLIGTSTSLGDGSPFQVVNDSANPIEVFRGQSSADGPILLLNKSRGSTASPSIVSNNDQTGAIAFKAYDGSSYVTSSLIRGFVDDTPGTNDMPGRLVFSTTADGASSPTERVHITNDGRFISFSDVNSLFRSAITSSTDSVFTIQTGSTNIGNGTTKFRVMGDGDAENTNNRYGAISDVKLKENIVDANSQWDDIKSLRVRKYNFKEETGYSTHTQIGLVAQEVETVCPGLVGESNDTDDDLNETGTTTKSVSYSVLYMKAVKALQEAMERIEQLEAKVAALEAG